MQRSLCRFLTFDICVLIASCYRVVFLVIVPSSSQGLCIWNYEACFLKLKTELLWVLLPSLRQQKRHSNLPEDLRPPPMLLKATRGFPHGNFYTSWQVAQTPELRKTPNDDWERVHTTLKTCWVANIGVCRKAGFGIGGGHRRERFFSLFFEGGGVH